MKSCATLRACERLLRVVRACGTSRATNSPCAVHGHALFAKQRDQSFGRFASSAAAQQPDANPSEINKSAPADELQLLQAPLQHPDFFGVKDLVTVEDLFEARVHFGHKQGSRNE